MRKTRARIGELFGSPAIGNVALDEGGRNWRPYQVSGLPAAAIIDQDGILRWRGHYTFMGQSLLEELLPE